MSSLRRSAAHVLLLLTTLQTASAHATSASISGVGPRTQALAGAGASIDVGYEAAFQNPAALSLTSQPTLSAGYQVTSSQLYWQRGDQSEARVPTDQLRATLLGFALPLWLGEQRLVLGLASLSPGGFVARADLPLPEQPQFPLLVSWRQAVDFDLGLGMRPFSFLALGAGVRALSSLSGTASVERGRAGTTTRVDDALEPVLAPQLGVSAFFADTGVLSLVFRGALRADLDVRLGAVDLGATQLPPLNLTGVAHYDPLSLHAEYAQRLGALTGLAGVTYKRYRDTPTLLPRTVDCPAERPDCQALGAASPELHDTFDLHLAASYRLELTRAATAELRGGYAYLPSPVPEQRRSSNLLDSARHRLALGYGVMLSEPWPELGLDLAAQLDQLVERVHEKAEDVAHENPGWPALTTRGSIASASLALTVKLR